MDTAQAVEEVMSDEFEGWSISDLEDGGDHNGN